MLLLSNACLYTGRTHTSSNMRRRCATIVACPPSPVGIGAESVDADAGAGGYARDRVRELLLRARAWVDQGRSLSRARTMA